MTATTSVGLLLVAADDERVVAIFIEEGRTANITLGKLRRRFPKSKFSDNHVRPLLSAVVQFIETPKANLLLPMEIRGTSFQQKVWREVLKIPFGQTTSFAVIAKQIGVPKAVRAVGNACSQNPLEFAIPCHRVLRSNGSWSGGSVWGDFRQSTLVAREAEANGSQ
jgi:AraC family transcriptional regulator of adaptative response/methylated-DNA-[protein]-cysteine methyltransferase